MLLEAIKSEKYNTIILNYANPDMVGHTGNLEAAIKAIETIDECVARVVAAIEGTIATPQEPSIVTTSTWTVGFPLESSISLAKTSVILLTMFTSHNIQLYYF